jgi:hypothetical protein
MAFQSSYGHYAPEASGEKCLNKFPCSKLIFWNHEPVHLTKGFELKNGEPHPKDVHI